MMALKTASYMNRKMLADALNPYKVILSLFPIFGISSAREERIRWLANEIKEEMLKTKKTIDIQNIMEEYGVNAIDAYDALKTLEEEGILIELD